jgi:hypothetical protein
VLCNIRLKGIRVLHILSYIRTALIQKDGGNRPLDVLATR